MDDEKITEGMAPAETDAEYADEVLGEEAERELVDKHRRGFAQDLEGERENRERAEKWERFKLGGSFQWDDAREPGQTPGGSDRAELTVNLIPQFVNQVVNDQRQNRQEIKVRPADSIADPDTAKVVNGLLRHIQQQSMATWAYDWAMQQSVTSGWGYFWIEPEYVDDDTNNQELRIRWIASRFEVVFDRESRLPWGGDARRAYRTGWVERAELEALGGAAADAAGGYGGDWPEAWGDRAVWERAEGDSEQIRVCSAWWLEREYVTVKGVRRLTTTPTLRWCKMTARKIIEGPRRLPGHRIPGVRVVGNMDVLREGLRLYGLVELLGPQQEFFNYTKTDVAERLSLTPKVGVIMAEGQAGGHEQEWQDAVSGRPVAVATYKPTLLNDTQAAPPPMIPGFPQIPAAHVALMQQSEHELRASVGMYEASLGQRQGQEVSGRALLQRRREGDAATFHYHDYMSYALHWAGVILVELLPHYYDWQETASILGEDGSERFVRLAPPGTLTNAGGKPVSRRVQLRDDAPGQKEVIYDLRAGRYDVYVDTGPTYSTRREEAAESLGQLLPILGDNAMLGMDLFLRNLDFPEGDRLAERFKTLVGQLYPWVKALEETEGQPMDDRERAIQAEARLAQLAQAMQAMQAEMQAMAQQLENRELEAQVRLQVAFLKFLTEQVESKAMINIEQMRAQVKLIGESLRAESKRTTRAGEQPAPTIGGGF
jgi:hypothetical protein